MTAETMPIEDYLAKGGVLTSPANVPARYRGELLRLMATFVDSELAASAGKSKVVPVELHVMPTSGHTIHATAHAEAAAWILANLPGRKP